MAIQAEERKCHPLKQEEVTLLLHMYSTSKSIFVLVNGCFCIQAGRMTSENEFLYISGMAIGLKLILLQFFREKMD